MGEEEIRRMMLDYIIEHGFWLHKDFADERINECIICMYGHASGSFMLHVLGRQTSTYQSYLGLDLGFRCNSYSKCSNYHALRTRTHVAQRPDSSISDIPSPSIWGSRSLDRFRS